ncbi:MAG TPA: MscL family protein [Candidatus Sulfotelmatobacter sp.]|nr:MscL family protein [Candidatus Sulfotelmatobacter sp.]
MPRKKSQPVVTTAGNIRFESTPKDRTHKPTRSKAAVGIASHIRPGHGFFDFLREHAVVGLVIGFVLGTQVQVLVKQLVQSFIDPLTQLVFGTAVSAKSFTLHFNGRSAQFQWGALVYSLVIFLFVLLTLYILLKMLRLDKFDKKNDESK